MKRSELIKKDAIEIASVVVSEAMDFDGTGEITINIMRYANDWKENAISAGVYELEDEYEFFNHFEEYATELLTTNGYEVKVDEDLLIATSLLITINDDDEYNFEDLQNLVGGTIEVINLANGKIMVVNEDGQIMELTPNPLATEYCKKNGGIITLPIVGTAIVMTSEKWDEIAN